MDSTQQDQPTIYNSLEKHLHCQLSTPGEPKPCLNAGFHLVDAPKQGLDSGATPDQGMAE
jgi:hypothetical protein